MTIQDEAKTVADGLSPNAKAVLLGEYCSSYCAGSAELERKGLETTEGERTLLGRECLERLAMLRYYVDGTDDATE